MATATQNQTLDRRETASLIGSDKVEGTPVYRSNGDRVGQIERVMIDKLSGKVAYAVMSFGGFLGIGEDYYPLPWSLLTYNPRLEGLRGQCRRAAAQGCAEIFQARELGLVRPHPRQAGLRLLRRRRPTGPKPGQETDGGHCEPPATAGGFFMASRQRGPPGRAPISLEFGFICYISRVSLRRPVDTRADLDCRIDHRGEGMGHEVPPALRFPGRCSEPTLFHRRYCLYGPRPVGGPGAIVGPGIRRGCPVHAHGDRGSAAGRLPIRCRDRAGRRGYCPRAQPRTHHQRSDRAWRDGRDPAVPCRAWPRRVARQHALHVGRILRDVHGRDHLVSHGAAGLWRRRSRNSPPRSTRSC